MEQFLRKVQRINNESNRALEKKESRSGDANKSVAIVKSKF